MKKALIILMILLSAGCKPLSDNAETAKLHLEEMGYEIVSFEEEGWYEFTASEMIMMPHEQIWAVQTVKPDKYLDKKIDTVTFHIKNHPFDDMYGEGKTIATVYVFNGEVIGGWSYPYEKTNSLGGAPSSLDGRTAEEVQLDYMEWKREWEEKFGR